MRSLCALAAIVSAALAAPAVASAATLTVDPVKSCYREQDLVFLVAQGYTPNGHVDFTREGRLVKRLTADATGTIQANLTLPGLIMGRRRLTYVATDVTDRARTAQVSLLTSATDVRVSPENGAPNRVLTINALGFFRGQTLWAHVRHMKRRGGGRGHMKRRGGGRGRVRSVRVGRVTGPCFRVRAKRRLFRRNIAPGRYRVQFDTFRRYKPKRAVEYDELYVTILSRASAR